MSIIYSICASLQDCVASISKTIHNVLRNGAVKAMQKAILEYNQLQEMMDDFYQLTHIRISFWNSAGEKCFMAPSSGNSEFCCELRKIPNVDAKCHDCDKEALQNARKFDNRLYQFQCSAGLCEYVYPVFYHNTLLGYFMYGQVRNEAVDRNGLLQREALYRTNGLDRDHMTKLYEQLPFANEDAMLSAGRMMASIASFAYMNGFISDYNTPLAVKIKRYLESQYMNPITIDSACSFFNVSRSYLSHTIQKEMNSTFLKLLNQQRIKNVCKCLDNGQSIQEASDNSGFQSNNYMTRVFKKIMGYTPHEYREQGQIKG